MAEGKALRGVLYFLGGAALGAGIGLLFAPKEGKETREDINEWLKARREGSKKLVDKLRDTIPVKKEQVAAAFRAGKEAYSEANHHKKEAVGV